jgi:hypothetical protein
MTLLLLAWGCAATPREDAGVRTWGTMREVLREGRRQGRVELAQALGPSSVAVGALADLAGEITVDRGVLHLAEVVDAAVPDGARARAARPDEQAALLLCADVPAWSEHALPAAADLDALEEAVREAALRQSLDVRRPFPFRIEGRALRLELHVVDGSCPIAHPDGPPPWRYLGLDVDAVWIGFHAQDAAGELTHHGRRTHTHALVEGGATGGHVDDVRLASGARLFLPASGYRLAP